MTTRPCKRWWARAGSKRRDKEGGVVDPELQKRALAALAARASNHGGIPVGAVCVPAQRVEPLRKLFEAQGLAGLHFKGMEVLPGSGGRAIVAHLPSEAALMLDDAAEGSMVLQFLRETDAMYFPGVRPMDTTLLALAFPELVDERGAAAADVPPTAHCETPAASTAPAASFRFAEIFSGIGGFRVGLESLGGTCVLASDINQPAVDTYRANFGARGGQQQQDLVIGDVAEYSAEDLPDFDVLTGGFPCQPFSVRGLRKGLADSRGQLFRELVRILRAKRPGYGDAPRVHPYKPLLFVLKP